MESFLIPTTVVLLGSTLFSVSAFEAGTLVLEASGSDITINLPAKYNNNKLLNVISNTGNNNPSQYDMIGGNGANKDPHLSIGGDKQEGSKGANDFATALYNALLSDTSMVFGADHDEKVGNTGSNKGGTTKGTKGASGTKGVSAMKVPYTSISSLPNSWYEKFVTDAMVQSI